MSLEWRAARSARRHAERAATSRLRLDDIDEVAVQRAIEGVTSVPLNRGERRAVVAELTRRGMGARRIAQHVGTSERTIERDRGALRVAA